MPQQLYSEQDSEYLHQNPNWHVEDSPWKASKVMEMLNRNNLEPKSVVEVGCGFGEILNQMHGQMPEDVAFSGFDISPDAITAAKSRAKERLSFFEEDFLAKEEDYDLLLMIDVFEHVEDCFGFLRKTRPRATHHIFHIPLDISVQAVIRNTMMNQRKSVGHIHYYTKDTALATLRDCGYTIVDHMYTKGSMELSHQAGRSGMMKRIRRMAYRWNEDKASKLLGGSSLMVLAKG